MSICHPVVGIEWEIWMQLSADFRGLKAWVMKILPKESRVLVLLALWNCTLWDFLYANEPLIYLLKNIGWTRRNKRWLFSKPMLYQKLAFFCWWTLFLLLWFLVDGMMILESTMVQKTSTRKRETIKTLVDDDKKGEKNTSPWRNQGCQGVFTVSLILAREANVDVTGTLPSTSPLQVIKITKSIQWHSATWYDISIS